MKIRTDRRELPQGDVEFVLFLPVRRERTEAWHMQCTREQ